VYRGREENLPAARTAAFCTLAFSQLFFSFGCRSDRYTLPQLGLFSNPWLIGAIAASVLLQLAAITVPQLKPLFKVGSDDFTWQWLLIGVLALTPVSVVEVTKLVRACATTHMRTATASGNQQPKARDSL
jgi:Ca2+-transporting ATPase